MLFKKLLGSASWKAAPSASTPPPVRAAAVTSGAAAEGVPVVTGAGTGVVAPGRPIDERASVLQDEPRMIPERLREDFVDPGQILQPLVRAETRVPEPHLILGRGNGGKSMMLLFYSIARIALDLSKLK